MFHESRCGSTLVANMLGSIPYFRVYSESDPPVALAQELVINKKKGKSKFRTLEYDEDLGKDVAKRQRKRSRSRDDWEGLMDDD